PSSTDPPRKTRSRTSLRNGHWRERACSKPASAIVRTRSASASANPTTTFGTLGMTVGMAFATSSFISPRRFSWHVPPSLGRYEAAGPVPDEIRPPGPRQCLARELVVGVVPPAEERLHHPLLAQIANDRHRLHRERVDAGDVHRRGNGHGRRNEILHLARAHVLGLEPEPELDRVLDGRPRVAADEIRHEVLLFARLLARLTERLREALVVLDRRLLHLVEHFRVRVLGGDAELPARVVGRELANKLGAPHGVVVANAARDVDTLDPRLGPHAAEEIDERRVVGHQVLADADRKSTR